MNPRKFLPGLAVAAASLVLALSASAAMVQKFDLGGLVGNADKVFRGTVISAEPGKVRAGGGELDTIVYTIRVSDPIKGSFGSGKAAETVTIQMLGSLKQQPVSGNVVRLARTSINPELKVGSEYVLFTTRPSRFGLSTTVGLNQGLFRIFSGAQGRELTTNDLDNAGLGGEAVDYGDLVSAIKSEIR